MKEIKEVREQKTDPINVAIDTPKDKLPQFTIIPTGGVVPFAMSKTIQQFGKDNAFNGTTPMEYFIDTIFQYNRSRGGIMLAGLMRLAQTKAEVTADQEVEARKFEV